MGLTELRGYRFTTKMRISPVGERSLPDLWRAERWCTEGWCRNPDLSRSRGGAHQDRQVRPLRPTALPSDRMRSAETGWCRSCWRGSASCRRCARWTWKRSIAVILWLFVHPGHRFVHPLNKRTQLSSTLRNNQEQLPYNSQVFLLLRPWWMRGKSQSPLYEQG